RVGVRAAGKIEFAGGVRPSAEMLPTRGIYLRSLDHRFFHSFQLASASEDGTFTTASVPPGRYVLGVMDQFDGYQLESVSVEGREVAGLGFDLQRDATDVTLRFSARPTAIAGNVSGKSGDQRYVILAPGDEGQWSGRGTELGRVKSVVTTD